MKSPSDQLRERLMAQYERNGFVPDGREEELIDRACVVAEVIAGLEAAIAESGPVTADGRIAPAVVELRQQNGLYLKLLGAVDFGTEDGQGAADLATLRGRKAAQARWAGHPSRKASNG